MIFRLFRHDEIGSTHRKYIVIELVSKSADFQFKQWNICLKTIKN